MSRAIDSKQALHTVESICLKPHNRRSDILQCKELWNNFVIICWCFPTTLMGLFIADALENGRFLLSVPENRLSHLISRICVVLQCLESYIDSVKAATHQTLNDIMSHQDFTLCFPSCQHTKQFSYFFQ